MSGTGLLGRVTRLPASPRLPDYLPAEPAGRNLGTLHKTSKDEEVRRQKVGGGGGRGRKKEEDKEK